MNPKNEKNEIGAITGIIIVIIVLTIGAFYFFKQRIEKQRHINALIQQEQQVANSTATDSITSIQQDAATVDTKDLGNGISNLK